MAKHSLTEEQSANVRVLEAATKAMARLAKQAGASQAQINKAQGK